MAVFYRRLPKFECLWPDTLDDALAELAGHKGPARLLAGGTDLVPLLRRREIAPPDYVIDLKSIPGLPALSYDREAGLTIGPLDTISAVAHAPALESAFPALVQAARSMASPQVRNRGTIAGNICSAVPSADSAPALLVLGATVACRGPNGERTLPLEEFFKGPRVTALNADEMLTAITVPSLPSGARSVYLKLSPRHSMDLAIVGVAACARIEDGVCRDVRVALGAVAPTPVRARGAETVLEGVAPTQAAVEEAARAASGECRPIDDHRASAEYRCDMVYVMTRRALTQVLLS